VSVDAERAEELSQLCRSCGACCSGAVFGYVPLEPGELSVETRRKLKVFTEGGGERFKLACPGLVGAVCSVYADRPQVCRGYTCGLYAEHEREGGELETKLAKVRRIRELLDKIRAGADESNGAWLPAPIAEIVEWDANRMNTLLTSVGAETLLDIAELGMRVRRDLGHVPKKQS
jgi:Fe-S-cluster containining protein